MGIPRQGSQEASVVPVQYTETSVSENVQLRAETEQLRKELLDLRTRLDQLTLDGAQRNQALIAARAEMGRLREEIQGLQQELAQWQSDMSQLRDSLLARNDQRVREIRDLATAVESLSQKFQSSLHSWESDLEAATIPRK